MNSKGYTLVELIIVLVILSILSLFVVSSVLKYTQLAYESVCLTNRKVIRQNYEQYLFSNNQNHSDAVFEEFMLLMDHEICPNRGVFIYHQDGIICSKHSNIEEDTQVPYLYAK